MENKTESYIVLKPIAERVNRIANEITDTEIKDLIKSSLREQIACMDLGSYLRDIADSYFDSDEQVVKIQKMIEESIKNKLREGDK